MLTNFNWFTALIFLILISGFLSGSETAITAVSKPRIISKIKQGSKRALYVKKIIDLKESVISALLLSNNLVNIDTVEIQREVSIEAYEKINRKYITK